MLKPRIIASLLIRENGLIKTTKFGSPRYLGDPMNAVRIFNEKQVDELAIFDISCTVRNTEPNYKLIENIAAECRMPFCYGGGITNISQAQRIFSFGVEKIALSSSAFRDISLVKDLSLKVGSQSVVVVLDVKRNLFGGYDIYTHNGNLKVKGRIKDHIQNFEKNGAGEIIINNITEDGMMQGYDLKLVGDILHSTQLPVTILGGAGSMHDIGKLIESYGIVGCAAGSLFVYKGKLKAVLINYPDRLTKDDIIKKYHSY